MRTIPQIGFPPQTYLDYTLQIEPFAKCLAEMAPLHKAQWAEIEEQRPPFNPDYSRIMKAENDGGYFQITVRHNKALVGGLGFFVFPNLHTQQWYAEESAFYISPAHRKGLLASALIRYGLSVLRALRVVEVNATVKSYAKTASILRRLGFRKTDEVFMIRLEN